jgi:hypothetical protein
LGHTICTDQKPGFCKVVKSAAERRCMVKISVTLLSDILRITSGLVGNLPLYCNSGKGDPLARDEKGRWNDGVGASIENSEL